MRSAKDRRRGGRGGKKKREIQFQDLISVRCTFANGKVNKLYDGVCGLCRGRGHALIAGVVCLCIHPCVLTPSDILCEIDLTDGLVAPLGFCLHGCLSLSLSLPAHLHQNLAIWDKQSI